MDSTETFNPPTLLLVDDDADLCSMVKEFFAANGHHVDCAYNGLEGLNRALNGNYQLVILDVMLPTVNGFTLLHQLRRRKDVPVIMLTARTAREDRIQGLETGADDYLLKPFDPDELLARVRAVLRRCGRKAQRATGALTVGTLRIDLPGREVWRGERYVDLTSLEFDILELLIRSEGRICMRDEISAAILAREATPYDRSLDVHISHLRKKLKHEGRYIRTIRGLGYVFTPHD